MDLKTKLLAIATTLTAGLGGATIAKAGYISDATTTLDSMLTDIGSILFSGLSTAFTLFAALIGLFFIVRLIRKYIGNGR